MKKTKIGLAMIAVATSWIGISPDVMAQSCSPHLKCLDGQQSCFEVTCRKVSDQLDLWYICPYTPIKGCTLVANQPVDDCTITQTNCSQPAAVYEDAECTTASSIPYTCAVIGQSTCS